MSSRQTESANELLVLPVLWLSVRQWVGLSVSSHSFATSQPETILPRTFDQ